MLKNFKNVVGRSLNKKVLVIESDDWGSIRMPSRNAYDTLKKAGVNLGKGESERYNKFDTLASTRDLEALFTVLRSIKNQFGEHPRITAVSLVANPNFQKIRKAGFSEYFWEDLPKTFERYNNYKALDLWKVGLNENLFYPEFHGREHLNVAAWMRSLLAKDRNTCVAFNHGFWGFKRNFDEVNFQAAFDLEKTIDLKMQANIIREGLATFEKIHGYQARFFVPPNGPFNNHLQEVAFSSGIRYISTAKIQMEPLGDGNYRRRFHYIGKNSKVGLIYLTRNAFFEPSAGGKNWVDTCLKEIESAFKWRKPAVISSHRVNYIGAHDAKNSEKGLKQLSQLLKAVVKQWPDVHFLSSSELGDLYAIK